MQSASLQQSSLISRLWHSPTFTTWASLAARSLNLVLLIPFILRQFGPAEISLWYLFSTIISLNMLVDMGFGTTFVRFIAYATGSATPAQDGGERLGQVVGTQQVLFRWMTAFVLLLMLTAGTASVYRPVNLLPDPSGGWVAWAFVIGGTALTFWGNGFAIYLQGINRVAEFRRYEAIFSLASIVTSAIALLSGVSFVGLVAITQLWSVASALRNRWLCGQYGEGVFGRGTSFRLHKPVLAEIWPSAWRSGVGVLMSYGLIHGSSLIVAQNQSAETVSAYLFAMRVMQIVITFAQAPFYSKLPLLAQLYARQDLTQITNIARQGMRRAHWTFVAGVAGGLLAEPAMQFIGSTIHFVEPQLWLLMGLAFFVERYGAMHIQLYSISNHIVWHIANGVTGTIYLLCAWLLYSVIGVYAFPLSVLIGYCAFYSWYSADKSLKMVKTSAISYESKTSLVPFLILIILFGCSYFITQN